MVVPDRANPWVELEIRTHLTLSGARGRQQGSRNAINILSSDALIVLPGGAGTYSEATLRIDYGRRLILFLGDAGIDGHRAEHFVSRARHARQVSIAQSAEELEQLLREELREA